jgi:hypothetical protein
LNYPLASTALLAYSTWKIRPSGENCAADKSYFIIIANKNWNQI